MTTTLADGERNGPKWLAPDGWKYEVQDGSFRSKPSNTVLASPRY